MKSELYHTIYKVAVFCVIATLGLTVGGSCLSVLVMQDTDKPGTVIWVSWLVTAVGGILCICSVLVCRHFKKCFLKSAQEERLQEEKLQEVKADEDKLPEDKLPPEFP